MSNNDNKEYFPLKIPSNDEFQKAIEEEQQKRLQKELQKKETIKLDDNLFYEIEYDPGINKTAVPPPENIAGCKPSKYSRKPTGSRRFKFDPDILSQSTNYNAQITNSEPKNQNKSFSDFTLDIEKPEKTEPIKPQKHRDVFDKMREFARLYRSSQYLYYKPYDKRLQMENNLIFFKQAKFMEDFTDDYESAAPFNAYFPYYQQMNYEQLRTYFTWRTHTRSGEIAGTSLSYAFLYIYELLNNIGANGPQDGLDKLMSFWKEYRVIDDNVNKYIYKWLRDYHIYYDLPQPFKDFVIQNNLESHYKKVVEFDFNFDLYCSNSKYDIRKSAFFGENKKLLTGCFDFVMDRLRQIAKEIKLDLDYAILNYDRKVTVWNPFRDALFYNEKKQSIRKVVLSEFEIFIRRENTWTFSPVIIGDDGKKLLGYVMKQMEAAMRKLLKNKRKLTATIEMYHPVVSKLKLSGHSIEKIINDAALEYYKESTKVVVTVDHSSLKQIRREALDTQEKLIIPEHAVGDAANPCDGEPSVPVSNVPQINAQLNGVSKIPPPTIENPTTTNNIWDNFKETLNTIELQALSVILQTGNIKQYADENNIMLEVLVDGINEKAMDCIGDNLLDDEMVVYDDYLSDIQNILEVK